MFMFEKAKQKLCKYGSLCVFTSL